ncbi:thioredoxin family protein [Pedobacter nyackensis]|uniref:thioredoxin family protein n=1 Tax=Pedobacter nyackensis TaxID=475255 RepID=UPI002930C2B1|nr:thioredoxin fold domain-containing protein [Pedobacter nyackensis]
MKKIVLLFLFIPLLGSAQNTGTHFEHGLSLQQVKEKAKKENKYLFLDCFTTWCGPCKYMSINIFPQEKVGDFFNKNFVNVKVQFDKTKDDSEEVKSWYADVESLRKEFNVRAYPTFLIFSPQGEPVHRFVGGGEADDLIASAQKALNPETQYYTVLKKQGAGNPSPETLKELVALAEAAYDEGNASKFASAYLATQKDPYSKANLEFISQNAKNSKSKGFELMLKDPKKVDAVLGKGKANEFLASVILSENIYPQLRKPNVNIDSLIAAATAKYPTVDISKSTSLLKLQFYQRTKKWDKFQPAVLTYLKKYGTEVTAEVLNSFARTFFNNCKDPNCLATAMAWSKRSVEETQEKEPSFLDTYANLLYKMEKKEEAIAMQQKAVDLASADQKDEYQATLDQMKKGK